MLRKNKSIEYRVEVTIRNEQNDEMIPVADPKDDVDNNDRKRGQNTITTEVK